MKLALSLSLMATTASSQYTQWQPHPASSLGSTSERFGVQSVCEGQYMGADCTEKVCAYGLSATASPFLRGDGEGDNKWSPGSNQYNTDFNGGSRALKDGSVHTYTECSSQGICDRLTGTCQCFDGFSGKGCRRTECPNDCSGHGMCNRNIDVNQDYAVADAPDHYFATQYWDGVKTMRCECDRGFEGADCSLRICPHGDDVLTTCASDSNYDVQVITFDDPDSELDAATEPLYYTLTFEDHFGGKYKSRPISLNDVPNQNALDAQAALEALPNFAIPSVQVTSVVDLASDVVTINVAFTDSATTGKQNTLMANIVKNADVCRDTGGQTPLIDNSLNFEAVMVSVAHSPLSDTSSSYEENVPCGNRGICDASVGTCECFEGHTGEACEIQSVFV